MSHSNRVSLIKLETYWTRIFDYYGITSSSEDETLQKAAEDDISLYSEAGFLMDIENPRKIKADSELTFNQILSGKLYE